MSNKLIKIAAITALLGATTLGITACSNSEDKGNNSKPTATAIPVPSNVDDISSDVSTQTEDAYIVGPIFGTPAELLVAKKVKVPAGSQLFISQLDSGNQASWTATSSNEKVAVFIQGTNGTADNMTGIVPSFNVKSIGTSDIILTNSETKETVNFTIEGIPVQ